MKFLIITLGLFFSSAQALELNRISGYSTFSWDEGGSEIAAYDPTRSRIFVTNNITKTVDVLSIANLPYAKKEISINPRVGVGAINSVAVSEKAGLLALAIEAENKQENGMVLFYNLATLKLAFGYSVGALPDNVAFTPDGKYALVANEGEPNDDYSIDPKGSVSIIDLNNWFVGASEDRIRHIYFTRNGAPEGGRIVKPGATFEQDAEPEYIAVSGDSKHAYVSLQENNVIAKINIEYGIVTDYFGLGYKDWSQSALDASNKDNRINIQPWPVKGMYQPDTIVVVSKEINGEIYDYVLMANEGDAKDYDGFSEEVRVKDLTLDPSVFPNAEELQKSENLGRLKQPLLWVMRTMMVFMKKSMVMGEDLSQSWMVTQETLSTIVVTILLFKLPSQDFLIGTKMQDPLTIEVMTKELSLKRLQLERLMANPMLLWA